MSEGLYIDQPIEGLREPCVLCGRIVEPGERTAHSIRDVNGALTWPHAACMLREVVGGIGHLIAHAYWCDFRHDPDAGLERWQSAQLVELYVHLVGITPREEVTHADDRPAADPGAAATE
jgi:hypothetical protein